MRALRFVRRHPVLVSWLAGWISCMVTAWLVWGGAWPIGIGWGYLFLTALVREVSGVDEIDYVPAKERRRREHDRAVAAKLSPADREWLIEHGWRAPR